MCLADFPERKSFWVDVVVHRKEGSDRSSFLVPSVARALECAQRYYSDFSGTGEILLFVERSDSGYEKESLLFVHFNRGEYGGDAV